MSQRDEQDEWLSQKLRERQEEELERWLLDESNQRVLREHPGLREATERLMVIALARRLEKAPPHVRIQLELQSLRRQ